MRRKLHELHEGLLALETPSGRKGKLGSCIPRVHFRLLRLAAGKAVAEAGAGAGFRGERRTASARALPFDAATTAFSGED